MSELGSVIHGIASSFIVLLGVAFGGFVGFEFGKYTGRFDEIKQRSAWEERQEAARKLWEQLKEDATRIQKIADPNIKINLEDK